MMVVGRVSIVCIIMVHLLLLHLLVPRTLSSEPDASPTVHCHYVLSWGSSVGPMVTQARRHAPRKHAVMIPGPQAHAAKIAFEKYYMWKMRHGYVNLP